MRWPYICDATEEEFAVNSPVKQRNRRTKRDREPFRIRVNKLLRMLIRANLKYQLMNNVSNTSFIMNLCKNTIVIQNMCSS